MNIIGYLREINIQMSANAAKRDKLFLRSAEQEKGKLSSFSEPRDLMERSYYQYLCQNYISKKGKAFIYSIAAAVVLLPITLYLRIKHNSINSIKQADAVSVMDFKAQGLLPPELDELYDTIEVIYNGSESLTKEDWVYIKRLIAKYWRSPYFVLKCALRIAAYSAAIRSYNPKAILASAEYSFTSSVLTDYCQQCGVVHINIMHGEKCFCIIDSFFQFTACFVWDEHYVNLFNKLRAMPTQFIVSRPPVLSITRLPGDETVDMTIKYYLANPNEEELATIFKNLQAFRDEGYSILVRPHPLWTDRKMVVNMLPADVIEWPSEVGIEDSIKQAQYVVAEQSTVLYQAYLCGKKCIIDDIVRPDVFEQLKDRDYIMLSRPHFLFSDVMNHLSDIVTEKALIPP